MEIEIDRHKFLLYLKIFMPIYWIPILGKWWKEKYLTRLIYRLDDEFIVCEHGVFFYSKKKVPYKAIREASIYRGPILQLFGGSVVKVHTASQNQGWPEIYFICPSNPESLVEQITKQATELNKTS